MTSRALISGPMAYLPKFMPRIFAVAVLLLAAAASAQAQERMGAVVMQDMLAGNTISGKTATGSNFSIYNNLNGKMSGQTSRDSETFYDIGTLEVTKDGELCRQWDRWRNGAYECYRFYRLGPNRFRSEAVKDDRSAIFRFRTGDPEGLRVRM